MLNFFLHFFAEVFPKLFICFKEQAAYIFTVSGEVSVFIFDFYLCVWGCVYIRAGVHTKAGAHRGWRLQTTGELGLFVIVSLPMCILGTK